VSAKEAAAQLPGLAQAHALYRLYFESEGHYPKSFEIFADFAERRVRAGRIQLTSDDYRAAEVTSWLAALLGWPPAVVASLARPGRAIRVRDDAEDGAGDRGGDH
jgi:hypothetical protein